MSRYRARMLKQGKITTWNCTSNAIRGTLSRAQLSRLKLEHFLPNISCEPRTRVGNSLLSSRTTILRSSPRLWSIHRFAMPLIAMIYQFARRPPLRSRARALCHPRSIPSSWANRHLRETSGVLEREK
jgi:hypothetical protein